MTQSAERLVERLRSLPDGEQESLAKWLLSEVESECAWDARFEASQDLLANMAAEALGEDDRGETSELTDSDFEAD